MGAKRRHTDNSLTIQLVQPVVNQSVNKYKALLYQCGDMLL